MTQPDNIIPDPYNPLDWNRYSYVRYNPINFNDPSGHAQSCGTEGNCRVEKQKEGAFLDFDATLLTDDWEGSAQDPHTSAYAGKAYNNYLEVLKKLDKEKITIRELLATLSYNEFGVLLGSEYELSDEALGRQLYYWCGSDGLCQGDQLWQFLGSLEAWYNKSPDDLMYGMSNSNGIATAHHIYSEDSWRNGNQWDRPFAFGNPSLFPNAAKEILASGTGPGTTQATSMVLNVNLNPPYFVWSPWQRSYWRNRDKKLAPQ